MAEVLAHVDLDVRACGLAGEARAARAEGDGAFGGVCALEDVGDFARGVGEHDRFGGEEVVGGVACGGHPVDESSLDAAFVAHGSGDECGGGVHEILHRRARRA